jgi:hypothetical protein
MCIPKTTHSLLGVNDKEIRRVTESALSEA